MRTLFVIAAAALLTAGCSEPVTSAPPPMPDQQAPAQRVVIDVTIEDGRVTPTNAQVRAAVNEPIIIRVSSDAPDELHVHSSPEHTFEVKDEPLQSFQFEVAVPGRVDVELHDLHRVVATITVQ